MEFSSLALSEMIGLLTGIAGIGLLLSCIRLVRFLLKRRKPEGRGVPLRHEGRSGSLLLMVFSWPLLVLALFSFTTLGVVSCRVGFSQTAPVPPASTLSLATPENLTTLNAHSGSTLQTRSWGSDSSFISTEPIGANNAIYFGMDGPVYGKEVTIRAYHQSSGQPLWSTELGKVSASVSGSLLTMLPPGQSLVAADEMVYVTTYRPASPGVPPASSRIYALRAGDGSLAWSLPLSTSGEPGFVNLVAGAGLVIGFAEDGSISAWHARDGSVAWHLDGSAFPRSATSIGGQVAGEQTAFMADQTIYFARILSPARSSLLVALRVSDGQCLWQRDFTEAGSIVPIFGSGTHLYLEISESLYALDPTDGALLWQHSGIIGASAGIETGGAVYVSGSTYEGVTLEALRAGDGHALWSHFFASSSRAGAPVVLHNALFVSVGSKGAPLLENVCPGRPELPVAVFALNASDGSIYWRTSTSSLGLLGLTGSA